MADNFTYGGQAVMEGVMIRGHKTVVTAVRRPGGGVITKVQPLAAIYNGWMRKTPLLRGIIVLIESMVIGIKSLMYSANIALEEEEEEISNKMIWGLILLAAVLAVVLFMIIPLFLTRAIDPYISSSLVFHLIEGFVRLAIFIAYLKLVGLIPDIKRVFSYHGAEHKSVNAYEAGVPMEVEAVKNYSKAHARCGTNFLFVVLSIAIIVFAIIGRQELWLMVLWRVLLLPVIAALGYEFISFGAKHLKNPIIKVLVAPGLWLQSLTTSEPDDSQIEVALYAMKQAVAMDHTEEEAQPAS